MLFKDRREAGEKLAARLKGLGDKVLVLAIPRGGVVVAAPVARVLNAPLDVIIPRKVGAPINPEVAIGAVTQDGYVLWNEELMGRLGLNEADMQPAVEETLQEIKRRLLFYRGDSPPPVIQGKTVILVDDGIATGFTVKAALRSIARQEPSWLILAVPVAPAEVIPEMAAEVDEVVCLASPEPFYAVGQFYEDFDQTTDKEVCWLLHGE
ncbi:MAG: phosphoribosyltransferase [Bacillota bacterium]